MSILPSLLSAMFLFLNLFHCPHSFQSLCEQRFVGIICVQSLDIQWWTRQTKEVLPLGCLVHCDFVTTALRWYHGWELYWSFPTGHLISLQDLMHSQLQIFHSLVFSWKSFLTNHQSLRSLVSLADAFRRRTTSNIPGEGRECRAELVCWLTKVARLTWIQELKSLVHNRGSINTCWFYAGMNTSLLFNLFSLSQYVN